MTKELDLKPPDNVPFPHTPMPTRPEAVCSYYHGSGSVNTLVPCNCGNITSCPSCHDRGFRSEIVECVCQGI